jgi:hypothetical protein
VRALWCRACSDLSNHTFADPVSGLLRAVRPDDSLHCRVEIRAVPASALAPDAAAAGRGIRPGTGGGHPARCPQALYR